MGLMDRIEEALAITRQARRHAAALFEELRAGSEGRANENTKGSSDVELPKAA